VPDRLTEHGQHGAYQMLDAYLERPTRHAARLLDRLSEIWSIVSQSHSAAKIEILQATCRDDAIPQRAHVVGDGLPVAEPGSVEVGFCIAAPFDAQDMPNRASTEGVVRNLHWWHDEK
jgi:hypothetical protein